MSATHAQPGVCHCGQRLPCLDHDDDFTRRIWTMLRGYQGRVRQYLIEAQTGIGRGWTSWRQLLIVQVQCADISNTALAEEVSAVVRGLSVPARRLDMKLRLVVVLKDGPSATPKYLPLYEAEKGAVR